MEYERRKDYPDILDRLKHIEVLLMGNGKVGIAEMARRAFNRTEEWRTSKNGLLDWVFRVGIMILLGFIAAKVGLR